jgi:hypothetical protein
LARRLVLVSMSSQDYPDRPDRASAHARDGADYDELSATAELARTIASTFEKPRTARSDAFASRAINAPAIASATRRKSERAVLATDPMAGKRTLTWKRLSTAIEICLALVRGGGRGICRRLVPHRLAAATPSSRAASRSSSGCVAGGEGSLAEQLLPKPPTRSSSSRRTTRATWARPSTGRHCTAPHSRRFAR